MFVRRLHFIVIVSLSGLSRFGTRTLSFYYSESIKSSDQVDNTQSMEVAQITTQIILHRQDLVFLDCFEFPGCFPRITRFLTICSCCFISDLTSKLIIMSFCITVCYVVHKLL